MKQLTKVSLLVMAIIAISSSSFANGFDTPSPDHQGQMRMDELLQLPAGGITLVRSGKELIIMSGNGRFVIRGSIYDMWNGGKAIKTMAEAKEMSNRIHLQKMNLDTSDLMRFDYGNPKNKKYTVIFVDPSSPASGDLLKGVSKLIPQGYRFEVIVVPAMNGDSAIVSRKLSCLRKKNYEEATTMVLGWAFDFLPKKDMTCDLERLQRTLITSQVLGVQGFPTLIAPDGRVNQGSPDDLKQFIDGERP